MMTDTGAIRMYLLVMFLLPLLDAFDRVFARTAIRMDGTGTGLWPTRRIAWGIITDVLLLNGVRRDLRFLRLKLPVRTWGPIFTNYRWGETGFREHWLQWIEGGAHNPYCGWHIVPPLE
jgi:hypothetical protein